MMKMKQEQDDFDKYYTNPYVTILNMYEKDDDLKGIWIKAKSYQHLSTVSIYWNKTRLHKLFNLTNDEMKLIGGGPYSFNMGKWYLTHSKYFIEIWFSNVEEYKRLLMIRKIKPRMTRDWDKNHGIVRGSNKKIETTDDLDYIIKGKKWKSKFHNVLIGLSLYIPFLPFNNF